MFYTSGAGDRLIEQALLPLPVLALLDEEAQLLSRLSGELDVLLEVGCMHGLHLDWATRHDRAYVGIDVVARYVTAGRQLIAERGLSPSRYRLDCASAVDLAEVRLPPGRSLAFFPFNSVGNMADLGPVLDAVAAAGIPFLISSYGTDAYATQRRREYYQACGYSGLSVTESRIGVRFTAPAGLDTVAYHPPYLLAQLAARGRPAACLSFAEFGAMYITRELAPLLARSTVIGAGSGRSLEQ